MIGTTVGPYRVLAALGAGGMGEVYRARDTRLERDVAIKVLGADFASDQDRVRRFTVEAQATGALNHPNILAVYDIGIHEGTPYLVAELLEGETLRTRMDAGRLPLSKALDLARQVASGLAAAHAKGITHRDIKPENLFVTTDGRAKILDFGLAKLRGDVDDNVTRLNSATAAGVVLGTVGYMAPEQVRGDAADERSDIFSFGVVLYELLSGQRPFVGDTAVETMNAILTEDPPEIVTTGRPLPPALERVVRHCLEKKPDERFQSARDLAFALDALSSGSGLSTSAEAAVRSARPSRRWLPVLTAALALSCGWLVVAELRRPPVIDLAAYRYTPLAFDPELELNPAWSPDGKTVAYIKVGPAGMGSDLFIKDVETGIGQRITAGGSSPFWWPDGSRIGVLRSTGVWAVSRLGGNAELLQPGRFQAAALSRDGSTLAAWRFTSENGETRQTLVVATPPDGELREYAPAPFSLSVDINPVFLAFSPDGSRLLLSMWQVDASGVTPILWDVPYPEGQGEPRPMEFPALPRFRGPPNVSWMPDGHRVVAGGATLSNATDQLWMIDLSRKAASQISVGLTDQGQPAVSHDGARLAFLEGRSEFDLVEIPLDGGSVRNLHATSALEHSGSWVPGGERFVYLTDLGGGSTIRVRNVRDGTDRLVVRAPEGALLLGAVPDPAGQRVAYAQFVVDDGIWIAPLAGGEPVRLRQGPADEYGIAWSPDGEYIATRVTQGLRITRVGSTEPALSLPMDEGTSAMPEWSPDGAWVAVPVDRGIILVSRDGTRRRTLTPDYMAAAVQWSADSRELYQALLRQGRTDIVAVNVDTGTERVAATLGPDLIVRAPISPSLRMTLSADGRSLLTTVWRPKGDLWILDNFNPPPTGWRRWFSSR